MKKILSHALLFTGLVIAGTGCLKDKGFDNHEYGINDPDGSPAGVGFVLGLNAKNPRAIEVGTGQSINDIVLNLEGGVVPGQDVHITLAVEPTIVTNYNTANGTSTQVLPSTNYTFPLSVTIPAGQRFVSFNISIPNSATLNPAVEYGIGLRITSVDGGYVIARNLRNLFIGINIKNRWDGKYSNKGYFNHPLYANNYTTPIQLWTTGPNTVVMYSALFDEFCKPFNVGGGTINRFGTMAPVFTIDGVTNKVTNVVNYFGTGTWTLDPAYNSRYEPATKTFFVKYGYNGRIRDWTDTLIYTGSR